MEKVAFFTAVSFGDQPKSVSVVQSLLETVDDYFYLGGKKAYVIPGHVQQGSEGAILRNHSSNCWITAAKIISYIPLVFVAIMLVAKSVLRSLYTFHLIQAPYQDVQSHSSPSSSPSSIAQVPKVANSSDEELNDVQSHSSPSSSPSSIAQVSKVTNSSDEELNDVQSQSSSISFSSSTVTFRQELEKGIHISPETIQKIRQLKNKILQPKDAHKDDADITWYTNAQNFVFNLKSNPNLIFKMVPPNRTARSLGGVVSDAQQISQARFANMVKAVQVCAENRLNLLVIPRARMFEVDEMTLIAEERLDINPNESVQEHFYQLSGLDETARQLAIFIAKTGLSDVVWRNIPVVDTAPEFQGNRRVALIDLEEMGSARDGIFGGDYGRRGLVCCLSSETQINSVLAEAERQNITSRYDTSESIKAKRVKEIQADKSLQEFYEKNGILTNPRKRVQVDDLETLGLQLEETDDEGNPDATLREATIMVIANINEAIEKTPNDSSIKGKRNVLLNTNRGGLEYYAQVPYHAEMTREREEQTWIRRIINALIAKGHLFSLNGVNSRGYSIQA